MKYSFIATALIAGFLCFTTFASTAVAATKKVTCSRYMALSPVNINARGGSVIYKSNWNKVAHRELSFYEGNHSQKGAAFLVHYKSGLAPYKFSVEVRDSKCNLIGKMGRFPRCTNLGCGEHERWYFRTAGGSGMNPDQVAKAARSKGGSNTVFMELRNGMWARVSNVLNSREQK